MSQVMVSICCTTYNHEEYITDAIESFLMQKTNFDFEILIHDDASTDKTAEIIRAYEKKYPEIIKPIYQMENQYSKGIKVSGFNRERARGKYIATCEGDDYWIDPYKLQKQVDYMEKHPECSMCVHAAYRVNLNKQKKSKHIRPNIGNKIYSTEEVIEGGGGLFATNSKMYPTKFGLNRPAFYEKAPVGDYPFAIYLALQGTVYYIDEFMSARRVGVSGSWTTKMAGSCIAVKTQHKEQIEKMLKEIDKYSNYQYTNTINKFILKNRFNLMIQQRKFKEIKRGQYKKIYENLSMNRKIILLFMQMLPRRVITIVTDLKRKYI